MSSDPRFAKHLATLTKHAQVERGVLYFSSVPTDMRPNEVRLHFQQFGEVLRQKFVPFPIKHSASGKRHNSMQFKEGWMEFKKRGDAMRAAAVLNSKPVGVRRFRKAHGQTWNVKFLENFSWDTLVEDKESAIRERKFKEHRAKEAERAANEMFRAMVASKAKRSLGLKRDRDDEVEGEAARSDREPVSLPEEAREASQDGTEVIKESVTVKKKSVTRKVKKTRKE